MTSKPLTAFLTAFGIAALVLAATATARNDTWEYCTTQAWGWPCPWRVDYCECGGGETEYPVYSMIINPALAAGFAFCFSRLFVLRPKRKPPALGIGRVLRR